MRETEREKLSYSPKLNICKADCSEQDESVTRSET